MVDIFLTLMGRPTSNVGSEKKRQRLKRVLGLSDLPVLVHHQDGEPVQSSYRAAIEKT